MLLFVCLNFSAKAIVIGPDDSVQTTIRKLPSTAKEKSMIQCMDSKQLSYLVDHLFDMDTIPLDLIENINIAATRLQKTESKLSITENTILPLLPSSEFYTCWEINNLFPQKDMLRLKGDTSVTLSLQQNEHSLYVHPVNGIETSGFGWRDSTQHNGIDIDLNKGDKVVAAFDGMVRVAMRYGGFGNVIIVRHYNGLETVYGHLSKLKVKPGQLVAAGEVIGLGGSTGHSTGSHLHFEVRFKGVPINPKYLISFTKQELLYDELTIKKTRCGLAAYPPNVKFYTIEKGDTVFEIAKRFATTTTSIKQMNGATNGRLRLKVGQVINVVQ